MLRNLLALVVGVVALGGVTAVAAEKKAEAKTYEGKLVCTKCTLEETPACGHALKVTEAGKDVVYYVDDKKANHGKVCPAGTELAAKVTGVVVEKDGKKTITNAKVELLK